MTRFERMRFPSAVAAVAAFTLAFTLAGQSEADSVSVQVNALGDDAEEYLVDGPDPFVDLGFVDVNSSDLEIGSETNNLSVQLIGLRFASVAIPANATINSASIQFTVDEDDKNANPASFSIFGDLSPNPGDFGANLAITFNLSSRPPTANSDSWDNVPSWNGLTGTAGAASQTSDISSVVQELVDQGGWASGNAMVLLIEPKAGFEGANRTAESNTDVGAAVLNVDFTPIPEPTTALLGSLGFLAMALSRRRRLV